MAGFTIPFDAACVDGHFPDRAVVPGVVIVDRAIRLITAVDGNPIAGLRRVKFPSELSPGAYCEVDWYDRNGNIRFTCSAGGVSVAVGTLEPASPPGNVT